MLLSYNNNTYRISYGNVTMVENALENPNLVQVSVVSGCQIVVAPNAEAGIDYLPNGEYRQWTLTGRNTRLNNAGAHRIYARLNRTAQDALIIFSLNHYTVDGRIIHTSDGGAVTLTGEPSATYYYIEIGSITATDLPTAAATQDRELLFDGGYLATPQQNTENTGGWTQLMQLTANNLINFLKNVASFTLDGTLTILGALKLNNKQATDIARQADDATEPESGSDETLPTTAWLKGKFKAWLQRYFLRKDADDKTDHSLEVGQKLTVGDIFTALGNAFVKGALTVGDYLEGVRGMSVDAMGNIKARSMELSEYLAVPTLRFNEITLFKGYNLISAGGGVEVRSVTYENGAYTISTANEENIAIPFEEDDILTGYWYNFDDSGSTPEGERIQGFGKMMFRVAAVDQTAKTFAVVPKPDSGAVPVVNMTLGQTGNFTNTERQSYMVLDTRSGNCCLAMYEGVNAWEITEAMIPSWFGKRNTTRTIAGIPLNNYSAVLENIIMTGKIFQIDSITDEPILVPIDKGDYNLGQEYAYYDRVSYLGSLWLCVNENGTTEAPRENSTDWLEQVKRGDGVSGAGHWDSANTPYAANTIVSFAKCVFMSKVQTSEPPVAIMRFADGSYARMRNGGYILYGNSNSFTVHEDWTMLLDGRELQGESFQFLDLAEAPAVPKNGDTYYNTTEKVTYTYRNGTWYVMTKDGTDGKDGKDYEWIYKLGTDFNTAPEKPASVNEDDHVPEGWTDDPTGVDPTNIVEWACKRVRKSGEAWGEWSTPALWAKFGKNGVDGLQGLQGEKGEQGIPGKDGADGKTSYFHIKYSSVANPTSSSQMSETPSKYIGTYVDYTEADSTDPSKYTWSKFEGDPGANGIAGTNGEDGKTSYLHLAYANNATGTDGFSVSNSENKLYIGQYTDFTQADSTDPAKYKWTKIKGEKGEQGEQGKKGDKGEQGIPGADGKDGEDGLTSYIHIKYSDVNPPTSASQMNETGGKYIGTYVDFTEADSSSPSAYQWKQFKGDKGDTGAPGANGKDGTNGTNGTDGISILHKGHWNAASTPYAVGSLVSFAGAQYVATSSTSEPPLKILLTRSGGYLRKRDGGYLLAGTSTTAGINSSWSLMVQSTPAISYQIEAPVSAVNLNTVGAFTPSAFNATLKRTVGDTTSSWGNLYLACRGYNGTSWIQIVAPVQASSISITPTSIYSQWLVRAYKSVSDASAWNDNYSAERGVTKTESVKGDTGAAGALPRDRGVFSLTATEPYKWTLQYRDKVIYAFNGTYYNFLVKNFGSSVTAAPTSAAGDGNWEVMQNFDSVATSVLFTPTGKFGDFSFAGTKIESATKNADGTPVISMDSNTGKARFTDITMKGNIYTPLTIINADNFSQYVTARVGWVATAPNPSKYYQYINLEAAGLNVQLNHWEFFPGIVIMELNDILALPSRRSYMGCEMNFFMACQAPSDGTFIIRVLEWDAANGAFKNGFINPKCGWYYKFKMVNASGLIPSAAAVDGEDNDPESSNYKWICMSAQQIYTNFNLV